MDEATTVVALNPGVGTSPPPDWWTGVAEEDALRSLPLDGEGGLWAGAFVPPPPRPSYLDENVTSDGLTTCDLCAWAWRQDGLTFLVEPGPDTEEVGWVFTLAVVSILSAVIGAVIMITVLQCRNRIKSIGSTCSLCVARPPPPSSSERRGAHGNKDVALTLGGPPPGRWFSSRRRQQLCAATPAAENHYTVDAGDAVYAELDKESASSVSPAYQNTAFSGQDEEGTYEAVGEGEGPPRTTVQPSDYV